METLILKKILIVVNVKKTKQKNPIISLNPQIQAGIIFYYYYFAVLGFRKNMNKMYIYVYTYQKQEKNTKDLYIVDI